MQIVLKFVSFPQYYADLPAQSAVHGILTKDGLFDGHISTPYETYYIEPTSRYMSNDSDFHSVIYKASDVVHPALGVSLFLRSSEDMLT